MYYLYPLRYIVHNLNNRIMSDKMTAKKAIGELHEYRNLLMEDSSDSGVDTSCVMAKAMELFLEMEQACSCCGKNAPEICGSCVSDIAQETGDAAYHSR